MEDRALNFFLRKIDPTNKDDVLELFENERERLQCLVKLTDQHSAMKTPCIKELILVATEWCDSLTATDSIDLAEMLFPQLMAVLMLPSTSDSLKIRIIHIFIDVFKKSSNPNICIVMSDAPLDELLQSGPTSSVVNLLCHYWKSCEVNQTTALKMLSLFKDVAEEYLVKGGFIVLCHHMMVIDVTPRKVLLEGLRLLGSLNVNVIDLAAPIMINSISALVNLSCHSVCEEIRKASLEILIGITSPEKSTNFRLKYVHRVKEFITIETTMEHDQVALKNSLILDSFNSLKLQIRDGEY
mmetsp:Transcript_7758/g.16610  ORF Transcript_7758/g.16610 Transcript_7758/m.16610 type:complete len:298 (+) Transcript_7758:73-966(+)|eukprot:CAMPEP_0171362278 /NCGR_PEP_ID=MMETSP0879-20121228/2546_1 /TAXON_ID=67004 /ORGANISM="Thalassiosira weissflogii, Strain CCMP1336" /LENGTH=297 /DNA_ID=CAMNT_0011869141 /DNA_START=55 /DNA_END=948 /DNA_ORIENTATION=-